MPDSMTTKTEGPTRLVAQISLCVRTDVNGKPTWIADNRFEASTATDALSQVGAELDRGLANIPGFWGE